MRKALIILALCALCGFSVAQINNVTGVGFLTGLVDAVDSYWSAQTITATPTVPHATYSLTRLLRAKLIANPSANDANLDFTAGYFHAMTQSGNVRDMSALNSLIGYAEHNGSGTLTAAYGLRGYGINASSAGTISKAVGTAGLAQVSGNGTIADARGFEAHVLAGTGTITTGSGLYVKTPYLNGGTLGTSYGIYMEDQNVGSAKYAIYTNAGAVRFGDTVQIGSSGTAISDSRNIAYLRATLTTSAAASNNVAITGATASSKCSLTPTNASAATNIATTYVSAKTTDQITVTHTATANMNYDIICSVN